MAIPTLSRATKLKANQLQRSSTLSKVLSRETSKAHLSRSSTEPCQNSFGSNSDFASLKEDLCRWNDEMQGNDLEVLSFQMEQEQARFHIQHPMSLIFEDETEIEKLEESDKTFQLENVPSKEETAKNSLNIMQFVKRWSLTLTYVIVFIAVHATLFAVQSGTVAERIEELVNKSYQGLPMKVPDLANAHLVGIPLILSLFCNIHSLLKTNWRVIGVALMVFYHCYILLDHVAVFWTTQLFETAEFHFRFLHCVLFWTLESGSALLGYVNGAHWYVLLNVPNHLFFIWSDVSGINTSAYFEWGFKPWWLNVAVVHDCLVHALCIYAHTRKYFGKYTHHITVFLTGAMCIGTFLFHGDKVHFAHLVVHAMFL